MEKSEPPEKDSLLNVKWPSELDDDGIICDTLDTIIKRHEADYTRLYVELDELTLNKEGASLWHHTARWIKFEEDVDVGAQRWGKPHVGTLSVNAFNKMRKFLSLGEVFLDARLYGLQQINDALIRMCLSKQQFSEPDAEFLRKSINSEHARIKTMTQKRMDRFEHKIPRHAEGCKVKVANISCVESPICIFTRLQSSIRMTNAHSVDIPTRFIVLLIGNEAFTNELHEIGRCFGTLMSDDVFRGVAYKSKTKEELLVGLSEMFDKAWLLPPNEWDPSIMLDPPALKLGRQIQERKIGQSRGISLGDGGFKQEEESDEISYTGRLFGGLIDDVKRKAVHYGSDFSQGMTLQCFASFVFLYFAVLTPIITFGGLLGDATDNNISVVESLVGACIAGTLFHLFAGQPLTIIGSTGPILIFERICYTLTSNLELNYLEFRQWIGIWAAILCMVIVAFDGSFAVKFITRYTEESFATLISSIFIVDGMHKVFSIQDIGDCIIVCLTAIFGPTKFVLLT